VTTEGPCVFLVDDEPIMLVLWGGMLRAAGYRIEAFEQPEALLKRLSPTDRGCVVVDLRMPGLNGLELQRALLAQGVTLPLIFVSGSADVPSAVTAMKGGAIDFLAKPVTAPELCAAVDRAMEQDREFSRERAERARTRALWSALTPREQDVCRLLTKGFGDKQIAAELGTATTTVQAQRTRAMQKLQASSVAEVIQLMAKVGDSH
jgi:FixJ family two-component response regulator